MDRAAQIAAILSVCDTPPAALEVEGLGTVYVKMMNAYDAHHARVKVGDDKNDGLHVGRNLAVLICDEKGELLFDVNDPTHILKLSKMRPRIQNKIMRTANDLIEDEQGK